MDGRLPFVFEASGTETHFTNGFDPEPRARRIFSFPKPATLAKTLKSDAQMRSDLAGSEGGDEPDTSHDADIAAGYDDES